MASTLRNLSTYNPEDIQNAEDKIFGIVVSEWNSEITTALLDGALEALEKANVQPKNVHIVP